jgi:hypothetical protein
VAGGGTYNYGSIVLWSERSGLVNAAAHDLAYVECYDPTLDTWSAAPALPKGRSSHYACAVADTMYVLGGSRMRSGQEAC